MDGPTSGFNLSPSINCSILLKNWEKYRVYTHFNFREEQIFQGGVFFSNIRGEEILYRNSSRGTKFGKEEQGGGSEIRLRYSYLFDLYSEVKI